jgi:hypothetical protein
VQARDRHDARMMRHPPMIPDPGTAASDRGLSRRATTPPAPGRQGAEMERR